MLELNLRLLGDSGFKRGEREIGEADILRRVELVGPDAAGKLIAVAGVQGGIHHFPGLGARLVLKAKARIIAHPVIGRGIVPCDERIEEHRDGLLRIARGLCDDRAAEAARDGKEHPGCTQQHREQRELHVGVIFLLELYRPEDARCDEKGDEQEGGKRSRGPGRRGLRRDRCGSGLGRSANGRHGGRGFGCRFRRRRGRRVCDGVIRVLTHGGAVCRQQLLGVFDVIGEHHQRDRLGGEGKAAVVHKRMAVFGNVPVLVGNLEARLMQHEEALLLGLLQSLDDAWEALLLIIQQLQAADELTGGIDIVSIIIVRHVVQVNAHIGRGKLTELGVPADDAAAPEKHRPVVIRVDEGCVTHIFVGDVRIVAVPIKLAALDKVGEIHIERELVHTGGGLVFIAVYVVLLPSDEVAVPGGDLVARHIALLEHLIDYLFPGFPGVQRVIAIIGEGGKTERQAQGQHRGRGNCFSENLHCSLPKINS